MHDLFLDENPDVYSLPDLDTSSEVTDSTDTPTFDHRTSGNVWQDPWWDNQGQNKSVFDDRTYLTSWPEDFRFVVRIYS